MARTHTVGRRDLVKESVAANQRAIYRYVNRWTEALKHVEGASSERRKTMGAILTQEVVSIKVFSVFSWVFTKLRPQ
jgi:hypothetical protein